MLSEESEYLNNTFFTQWAKLSRNVLVLKKEDITKIMLLDNEDIESIYSLIKNGKIGHNNDWYGLYNYQMGFYSSTDKSVEDEIIKSNKFNKLLAQVKFFNGELQYTQCELDILDKWSKEFTCGELHNIFVDLILKSKSESLQMYKNSNIRDILEN